MLELITRERTPLAPSQKAILASLETKDWGEEDWDIKPADAPVSDAWNDGDETSANGSQAARKPATPADFSLFPKLVSLGLEETLSDGLCSDANDRVSRPRPCSFWGRVRLRGTCGSGHAGDGQLWPR